ncbi:DEAD/DEAH box helicase [Hydrocarboniclastica marina]|uniref:DEAD-box ATP-dependent RNA helicase RhpA n=1 Tax=Hydrocarboniclastica marina TaxID=2259620 RepID=A0A4P7XJH0_9ALTE|nr:DEAD/DEAH box helicase [Hydrocarboniclastica marina]MAL97614.1 ATP-dependent RNA helicase RhlE [Alteromonadaceae bacterium]QCF26704.1 ATP-dependent RNA helicase RhlE [Hydrocarboniclastica marina]
MSFESLDLRAELLRAVQDQKYTTPTDIQSQAIPIVMAGRDLMASAQTGTGKTAAFTLPLLHRLAEKPVNGKRQVRALILTPTRELAQQVTDNVVAYSRHLRIHSAAIYGGTSIVGQMRKLARGVDILVATPGRLIDHMDRGTVDLSQVEMLVLDEADRMLDMGFMPAIERILKSVPAQRQTLLFSATFSPTITRLAQRFLKNPETVTTAKANSTADSITQVAYRVDGNRKRELLTHLIGTNNWAQVLVFTRTKHGADRLARQLEEDGISSAAIHGNKSQGARTKALAQFKRKTVKALVATDVAARGIDIDNLPFVVNFDMPQNPEDYVHRIGRTGRGGQEGNAVSLVSGEENGQLAGVRRLVGSELGAEIVEGFEPTQRARPKPSSDRPRAARPPRRPHGSDRPASKHGRPGDRPAHAKVTHKPRAPRTANR